MCFVYFSLQTTATTKRTRRSRRETSSSSSSKSTVSSPSFSSTTTSSTSELSLDHKVPRVTDQPLVMPAPAQQRQEQQVVELVHCSQSVIFSSEASCDCAYSDEICDDPEWYVCSFMSVYYVLHLQCTISVVSTQKLQQPTDWHLLLYTNHNQ